MSPGISEDLAAWLRLSLTNGVGNATARKLLAAFGLPEQIFAQSQTILHSIVGSAKSLSLATEPEGFRAQLAVTAQWLEQDPLRRKVIPLGDANYPQSLLNIEDPPLLLYAIATESVWKEGLLANMGTNSLAVVGSRNPTPNGVVHARKFSEALAATGRTIVSGLALGIDGAAHEGALTGYKGSGIATVAVLGTGLDRVYPKAHFELAHRIAGNGILLSEYHIGTPALAENFPKRNRLIAGLSQGILVVEAALKSGSLITARMAAEQGKEVFAIPGSINSPQARGCHALIRQGAKLVESAQDILEEIAGISGSVVTDYNQSQEVEFQLNSDEAQLMEALGHDACSLDALQSRTGLETSVLLSRLLSLELAGCVTRLSGGLFQRLTAA